MTELPAPPVPADADLQDFPFMPLHVARLRDSDLAAEESPEACWYAVLLWAASWHQIPAGSLPDNDRVLMKLVGLGRDERTWKKHRDGALRGFVKCSDDRLYHPVVAEQVVSAWSERLAYRERKLRRTEAASKAAAARWGSETQCETHADGMRNASNEDAESIPDDAQSQCRKGEGQGEGQGENKKTRSTEREGEADFRLELEEPPPPPNLKPEHFVEVWNETASRLGRPCIRDLTPERRAQLKARINGHSIDDFRLVLGKIEQSPFLRGEKNWGGATFDWLIKKSNFQKVLEGNYDG